MKTLFVLFLLIITQSCSDLQKEGYLNRLEHQSVLIDSCENLAFDIYSENLYSTKEKTEQSILEFKNDYFGDTLPIEKANDLIDLKFSNAVFGDIIAKKSIIDTNIRSLNESHDYLFSDVENGLGLRSSYDQLILSEESKIVKLLSEIKSIKTAKDSCITLINTNE